MKITTTILAALIAATSASAETVFTTCTNNGIPPSTLQWTDEGKDGIADVRTLLLIIQGEVTQFRCSAGFIWCYEINRTVMHTLNLDVENGQYRTSFARYGDPEGPEGAWPISVLHDMSCTFTRY